MSFLWRLALLIVFHLVSHLFVMFGRGFGSFWSFWHLHFAIPWRRSHVSGKRRHDVLHVYTKTLRSVHQSLLQSRLQRATAIFGQIKVSVMGLANVAQARSLIDF